MIARQRRRALRRGDKPHAVSAPERHGLTHPRSRYDLCLGIPDPIGDAIAKLAVMSAGEWDGVTADEAERGVAVARENLTSGFGGRRLGYGLIKAAPLYEGGDWQQHGSRSATVSATVRSLQA